MRYKDTREMVENIKDVISNEIEGKVYDYHAADAIGISYDTLRLCKATNKIPFEEMVTFCFSRHLNVYDFLVSK